MHKRTIRSTFDVNMPATANAPKPYVSWLKTIKNGDKCHTHVALLHTRSMPSRWCWCQSSLSAVCWHCSYRQNSTINPGWPCIPSGCFQAMEQFAAVCPVRNDNVRLSSRTRGIFVPVAFQLTLPPVLSHWHTGLSASAGTFSLTVQCPCNFMQHHYNQFLVNNNNNNNNNSSNTVLYQFTAALLTEGLPNLTLTETGQQSSIFMALRTDCCY